VHPLAGDSNDHLVEVPSVARARRDRRSLRAGTPTRIRGTVDKLDGQNLTVKSRDGQALTIELAGNVTCVAAWQDAIVTRCAT
jgi:hypothetical protein